MLLLVQPRALNRYIDDSIPFTWKRRWQAYRMTVPLILFCCAILAPVHLAIMWLWRCEQNRTSSVRAKPE
jgi:hypothetical protein